MAITALLLPYANGLRAAAAAEDPHAPLMRGAVAMTAPHPVIEGESVGAKEGIGLLSTRDPDAGGEAAMISPPAFELRDLSRTSFLSDREARLAAYAAARADHGDETAPGDPEIEAILDLAAFYLGHAMLPEGRSMLGALSTVALPPAQAARRGALALGLEVLGPRPGPLPAAAGVLLDPVHSDWPDQPLMLALEAIRQGDPAGAAPYLPDLQPRIDALSGPMREVVLPRLLEAAIEGGDWRSARDLAALFQSNPILKGSTAYLYLLGRAAQDGDAPLAAFDSLVAAAEGDDLWAHKARLAIVELGLATETLELAEARDILHQASQLWRGDEHALDTAVRLAKIHAELGDQPAALEVLGRAIAIHSQSPRREGLREEAAARVEAFYAAGAEGSLPLGAFLAGHRRIAPGFWFEPGFPAQAERFAARFLAAGATDIAAAEFETIIEYLAVARDLGLAEVADTRLDRLTLLRAEALLEGGQHERLGALLAQGLRGEDAALLQAFEAVRIRHFAATGQSAQVLISTQTSEGARDLRIEAAAFFDEERWTEAHAAYDRLRRETAGTLRFTDAVRLLLSAHRSGARDYAIEFADAYPAMRDTPQWREITTGLLRHVPRVQPLNEGDAKARLEAADQTLGALGAIVPVAN
ncbi:hypothetical protein [Profundibacterium mesophilum]|uniref:Tetratricopeptide TPR 2 n=1 Tax=Profundibacterium mesophilum KAUST100406-0324 TaxID=1037889 RepID=A0A921NPH8_9RHOB|nr:hypothetical protein [Profundibacterium mesophilum]KAF0674645.1 tetratricopeptide TPR 2 [Profundibacterium mesophilum KAUST100406-0324]